MLFDITHQEFDSQNGYHERGYQADKQNNEFLRSEIKAEFNKFQRACAEHYRHGEKESIFRGNRPGNADQKRAHYCCAAS